MSSILWLSTIIGVALIGLETVKTRGHIPRLNGYDEDDIATRQTH